MTLDQAKDTLDEAAKDALKLLFVEEFKSVTGDVPKAEAHFENGFRLLVSTERKALEIVSRILGG